MDGVLNSKPQKNTIDKKSLVLMTAKQLFAKDGINDTPTAKIAKEAGVSNGILFHYFTSKEELVQAIYKESKENLYQYALSQIYEGATVKESIYTFWLASLEWYLEHHVDFEFISQFENLPSYHPEIEKSYKYIELCTRIANKGMDSGVLKSLSPMFLFQIINMIISVSVKNIKSNLNQTDSISYQNQLFEIAWDAIKK